MAHGVEGLGAEFPVEGQGAKPQWSWKLCSIWSSGGWAKFDTSDSIHGNLAGL